MPTPGEPDYRYHNCNLQAPYMKCKKMTMDSFNASKWEPSGICMSNGYRTTSKIHTFTETTLPCMTDNNFSGEFTMYVKSSAGFSAVILLILTKAADTFTFRDYYQTMGNLGTIVVSGANQLSFTVTFVQPAEVRWIFRGI